MKAIVFDLETQKLASEVGGFGNAKDMKISMIGAWRSDTAMYKIWPENKVDGFFEWVNWADTIIGYNQLGFDYKVLEPYTVNPRVFLNKKNIDLIQVVKKVAWGYKSLDEVCFGTLGFGKTIGTSSINAPSLYKEGKFNELYNYLLDDLQITVKLFFHIVKFKEIVYKGDKYSIEEDLEVIVNEEDTQLNLDF